MLSDIIKQFKWVDIFILIILFRICYIGMKSGLPIEFFKLLGILTAIYVSLHYYTGLSDLVQGRIGIKQIPLEFLDFILFAALAMAGYFVFVLLRTIFYRFIKMEAAPRLNQWGGLVLSMVRGFLFSGLVIFMLAISSIGYLKTSVVESYFGSRLSRIAPDTYRWLWDSVTSKFMGREKFNNTLAEIEKGLLVK